MSTVSTLWRLSLDSWIYQSWIFWRRTVLIACAKQPHRCFRCVHFNNLEADVVVLCMIVAFQGRPQPTLTINDGSLTGCDSKRPSPLSPPFKFLFQPCPWVIYADPHYLNIWNHPKTDSATRWDKQWSIHVNPIILCELNKHTDLTRTLRRHFTGDLPLPGAAWSAFFEASTCFRQSTIDESTQSTVNSCAIRIDLAVPVAFALLLGEMETWYLRLFEQDLNKGR